MGVLAVSGESTSSSAMSALQSPRPTSASTLRSRGVSSSSIAILFTILGNLDDLARAEAKLEESFDELERSLKNIDEAKRLGRVGRILAEFVARAVEGGVDGAIAFLRPLAPVIGEMLPDFFPKLATAFIPLDADQDGAERGLPQRFRDWGSRGLPMDHGVNNLLLPTGFTETWIPLGRTAEVMGLAHRHFNEPRDEDETYRRTGTFVWELYAAKPPRFWRSPSYSSGSDEWSRGAFRVNPYWFGDNAGNPAETFFAGLWELLRDHDIPFRLHWGRYQPIYPARDRRWVDSFAAQYPRWDDFLRPRAHRDPSNIFLTDYWRDRFGLWDAPAPRPVPGDTTGEGRR